MSNLKSKETLLLSTNSESNETTELRTLVGEDCPVLVKLCSSIVY